MHDRKKTPNTAFNEILEQVQKFQRELDRLGEVDADERQRTVDPQIQQAIDDLLSSPAHVPVGKLAQMYTDDQPGDEPADNREIDQFIADELQLSPNLTVEDLRRLRREFAIDNHPDRVGPAERRHATRRMSLVNVLIDKALKEKRAAKR
jgi:hypothetical protein